MKKLLYLIIICSIIILLDQVSKVYLISHLKAYPGYYIEVTSFFDLVYSWNYGMSFGMLGNYYQYSNIAFTLLNSLIISALIYLYFQSRFFTEIYAYAFIIGGGIGNIIDRVSKGAVFDFIFIHYDEYSFPAFNIADSCITIGAILYILHCVKSK